MPGRKRIYAAERLRVDPRSFLAALFPPGHAGPVYGYTPRVAADERGRLLERAAAQRNRHR